MIPVWRKRPLLVWFKLRLNLNGGVDKKNTWYKCSYYMYAKLPLMVQLGEQLQKAAACLSEAQDT